MFGLKKRQKKLAFNARILTTFGKLDQLDIANINGCSQRLATQLMDRYGWSPTDAQIKAERFSSNLSKMPHALTLGKCND